MQKIYNIYYPGKTNSYGYAVWKSPPMGGFKWLDYVEFNSDKYDCDSLRSCILKVNLAYPKELHKSHNNYPLVSGKWGFEREMLSNYQLKDA